MTVRTNRELLKVENNGKTFDKSKTNKETKLVLKRKMCLRKVDKNCSSSDADSLYWQKCDKLRKGKKTKA